MVLMLVEILIAYFNKNYINTEIFPKNLCRKISNASSVREDSDYDYEYVENAEQTADQIETAKGGQKGHF